MKSLLAAAAPFALICTPAMADHHEASHSAMSMQADPAMQAALSATNRGEDRARDAYRHPAETLAFFGVKPGMTVIDYMPAGGWYTRVLAPYVGSEGRYIGLTPTAANADNERFAGYFGGLPAKFAQASPAWNLTGAPMMTMASDDEALTAYEGKVDRAMIFREMHNLHRSGVLHGELARIRDLLADDGMLGIVQHRAKPWAPAAYTDGNMGYLRQQDVIALVEAHGFDLVATSEINANPRDTADHPKGVWELAPSFASERQDELAPVGESDRMTLLFRKRP